MLKVAHEAEERFGALLMAWWNGNGAAAVLAHEDEALLMERATGRRSLAILARSGGDEETTCILCAAVAALHAPRSEPPPDLIPLATWFEALLSGHARYGGLAGLCARTARALLAERREPAVLHGDVHHGNVLDFGERGFLAIDPKGLVGDRAFDYANLFRNPDIATATRDGRFARRLAVVGDVAGLERRRLLRWVLALAGLSSVWLRDDGAAADDDLTIMEIAAAELAFAGARPG